MTNPDWRHYSSFYFKSEQRDELLDPLGYGQPAELITSRHLVSIHGSHLVESGSGDYRNVASPSRMRDNLLDYYGDQIGNPWEFDGYVIADYEPQTGMTTPGEREPIEVGRCEALLAECLANLAVVLPKAKRAVWGHPSSPLWRPKGGGVHIEPEQLTAVWEQSDFVAFHDYTGVTEWTPSQRATSADRIAEAAATGLPFMQVVWPLAKQGDELTLIPQWDLLQRIEQGRRLGCFACCYWDSPGFEVDGQLARWREDRIELDAMQGVSPRSWIPFFNEIIRDDNRS